ncbi:MAG: hypothetical protein A2234_04180 [Elusimicrobia bacterium RIFOXYA2_FULL_58_8]|nr:MAG: hypothetical protein A2285_00615 [Elusimicrobia bacterium RIFOXYA12_FULL_57_11]OGS15092.1 MAG: hypothetical protein A2234_04180 [Elusimicrobia bacterium RIFOXYA2_FULL_58_8]
MNNRKGFTLIELLVVVLIIGILASVAVPQYFKVVERSRLAAPNSLFGAIAASQESNMVRYGSYTVDFTKLDQTFTGTGGACPTTTCVMGDFSYTLVTVGSAGFVINATRVGNTSSRYGAYVLTYTVPGNKVSISGGVGTYNNDLL